MPGVLHPEHTHLTIYVRFGQISNEHIKYFKNSHKQEADCWLGIQEKALRTVSTEIVKLETRHMYEDFLYEMENGMYYHFEFESDSISEEDLKRFREYEASTARI